MLFTTDMSASGPSALRASVATVAMTAGFVTVFGLFGVGVTVLAVSVGGYLPRADMGIGIILAGLGVWLLAGRELRHGWVGLANGL